MQTKLFKRVLTGVLSAALVITGVTVPTGNLQAAKTVKKLTVSQTLDDGTTAAVKKKGTVNVAYPKNAADAKYVAKGNFNVELTGKGASKGFKLKGAGTPVGDTGFFVEQTAAGTAEKVSVKVISKAKNKNGKKLKFPFKVAFVEDSTWTEATSLSITIDKNEMVIGDTAQISATVEPKDATVTYSSDKEAVATVDENGKVEAKGEGEATITAKAGSKTDSVVVTVYATAIELTGVDIDNVDPTPGTTINAVLTPSNAMNVAAYQWTLNGKNIDNATEASYTIPEDAKIGDKYNVVVTDTEGKTFTAAAPAIVSDGSVETVVNLTDAKQTKANAFLLTFNGDATKVPVVKDDIIVDAEDGTLTIPVQELTFSADGTAAEALLSVALTDGKSYSVSYKDDKIENIKASVGPVASVLVNTAVAQQNKKTNIEFSLLDANGIDVTSARNVDAECSVSVEGDVTYDNSRASNSTITMSTIGQTADITVTYNTNQTGAADIVGKGVITCIEAEAVIGTKMYALSDDINKKSECAKFYLGTIGASEGSITIAVDEENTDLFFCAVDENGKALEYDTYEADSSQDDIVGVSIQKDSGKYARMTVSGNKIGSANVIVTAISSGKKTPYTIPVTVTKAGVLDSIKVDVDKPTITNAVDPDYYGKITVTAKDSNGKEIPAERLQVSMETVNADKKEGQYVDVLADNAFGVSVSDLGFFTKDVNGLEGRYYAWGAMGGSQSIKVTVSEGDITKEKTVGVTVTTLPSTAWNLNNNSTQEGSAVTYAVELSSNTIDEDDNSAESARLYATIGSKFAGYVRQNEYGVTYIGAGGIEEDPKSKGAEATATVGKLTFTSNLKGDDYNGYEIKTVKGEDGTKGKYIISVNTGSADVTFLTVENVANKPVTVDLAGGLSAAEVAGRICDELADLNVQTDGALYTPTVSGVNVTLEQKQTVPVEYEPTITEYQGTGIEYDNAFTEVTKGVTPVAGEYVIGIAGTMTTDMALTVSGLGEANREYSLSTDAGTVASPEALYVAETIAAALADATKYDVSTNGADLVFTQKTPESVSVIPAIAITTPESGISVTPAGATGYAKTDGVTGAKAVYTIELTGQAENDGIIAVKGASTGVLYVQATEGMTANEFVSTTNGLAAAIDDAGIYTAKWDKGSDTLTLTAKEEKTVTAAPALAYVEPTITATTSVDITPIPADSATLSWTRSTSYDETKAWSKDNKKGTLTYTYNCNDTAAQAAEEFNELAYELGEPASYFIATGKETDNMTAGTGYTDKGVDPTGFDVVSSILVPSSSVISDVKAGVKLGAKYSTSRGYVALYNSKQNITGATKDEMGAYTGFLVIGSRNYSSDAWYVQGDETQRDEFFAATGNYSVLFTYVLDPYDTAKKKDATANLTVKNSIYVPTVNWTSRKVDSLDATSIAEVLEASVDMNNNTSLHESVVGLTGAWDTKNGGFKGIDVSGNKTTVKYAVVEEDGVNFYIPINATFTTE